MRLMGLAPAAAAGFTLALVASAGFLHWYAFIETYAFSATGIVLMLIFTCSMRSLPRAGWIVASAASVAMLITNWGLGLAARSEEHTSELQSLMSTSYAVCCLKNTRQETITY